MIARLFRGAIVAALALPALGCTNETGGPSLPYSVDGLGSISSDCVQYCRDLFESCSRVQACFSAGECRSVEPSECSARCADAPAVERALTDSGCYESFFEFQSCLTFRAVDGVCSVRDEHCGVEWGVYARCAGHVGS